MSTPDPHYPDTLQFLFSQLPMFQRIGAAAFKKDLTNTRKLLQALGNPHQQFLSIHVAGTNGKGSVTHMLASIFQTHGYQTGLYTSPHLLDFRERIRVNGEMISESQVVELTELMRESLGEIQPSFFEMTVAMAFRHFRDAGVNMAIIETGLGGRLDSTNVITPVLSVITNIGFDHMDMLGDTLEAIAFEKAGIIKADVPVVVGSVTPETEPVFRKIANERRAPLRLAQDAWRLELLESNDEGVSVDVYRLNKKVYEKLQLSLAGHYQLENLRTVLVALDQLERMGYEFDEEKVRLALANIQTYTGLAGRWQLLANQPKVIADTGHNAHGLSQSMQQLAAQDATEIHWVFGLVKEKDWNSIVTLLPKNAVYHLTQANIPRAMPIEQLTELMQVAGFKYEVAGSVKEGVKQAMNACPEDGLVFIGGSTFTVAEALPYFQGGQYVG